MKLDQIFEMDQPTALNRSEEDLRNLSDQRLMQVLKAARKEHYGWHKYDRDFSGVHNLTPAEQIEYKHDEKYYNMVKAEAARRPHLK